MVSFKKYACSEEGMGYFKLYENVQGEGGLRRAY